MDVPNKEKLDEIQRYFYLQLRSLYLWGNNDFGCLGDGSTKSRSVPARLKIISERMWGDVNGDRTIDISDATEIQMYLAELNDPGLEGILAGDVTADGTTDISDVTEIQLYLAELITEFPAESRS